MKTVIHVAGLNCYPCRRLRNPVAADVVVMYLGQIVEQGATQAVFDQPMHPYTQALLAAVPLPQPAPDGGATPLDGDIPSPINVPTGCPFHTRCPRRIGPACTQRTPPLLDGGDGRRVACHIYDPSVGA